MLSFICFVLHSWPTNNTFNNREISQLRFSLEFEKMNFLNGDEAAPLVPKHGIPASPRDDRSPFQKQLALYTILVSILFERMAFYTLAANLAVALESTTAGTHSVSPFVFYGE